MGQDSADQGSNVVHAGQIVEEVLNYLQTPGTTAPNVSQKCKNIYGYAVNEELIGFL
jgi:hypothetical protein